MLTERSCRQIPGEPHRRWLYDEYFDLMIWTGEDGQLFGFQLCYDKPGYERALTWTATAGFSHAAVDGQSGPFSRVTPILIPAGMFPAELVQREFEQRSVKIDPQVRQFVLEKMAAGYQPCQPPSQLRR